MANYVKSTNFYIKDSLLTGNPAKIIKGAEIDDEYNALAVAVNSKADLTSPTFTGVPIAPTASLGTSTTQIATTAFAIINGVPSGAIFLWSGSVISIPNGFNLCDGTNGTPDLRNRFVVGAGTTYAPLVTGGSNDASVPSHTHTFTGDALAAHSHTGNARNARLSINDIASTFIGTGGESSATAIATNTTSAGTPAGTISTTGVSVTNANMPAYLALAYIMKL